MSTVTWIWVYNAEIFSGGSSNLWKPVGLVAYQNLDFWFYWDTLLRNPIFLWKRNNSWNTLKCKTNGRLPNGERLQQTIVYLVSLPSLACIWPWKSFRFDFGKWEMGIQGLKTLAFWDCNPCLWPAAALCVHCCEDLKSCWHLWPNLLKADNTMLYSL